jgi:hypothetical protein
VLWQLHWQKMSDQKLTKFIAQGDFDSADDVGEWARKIIEKRKKEIPDGWGPLLCDDKAPMFRVIAAGD